VRFLLAIAITWIAVHLSNPARAQVRYLESADVQPADPACVRDAVRALLVSNFHADIVSANTVCRRDATVVVHEGVLQSPSGFTFKFARAAAAPAAPTVRAAPAAPTAPALAAARLAASRSAFLRS